MTALNIYRQTESWTNARRR